MIYFIIVLLIFLIDQGSKWLIVHRMSLYESFPVIGDFFQITSHRNSGAAFGILEGRRWFFIVITIVVVSVLISYLRSTVRDKKRLLSFALSLLMGGALGNFLDRALTGEVVDFLQFRFQFAWFGKDIDYIFPIFNVADSAIVIGVILIFLDSLLAWSKERKDKVNEFHES